MIPRPDRILLLGEAPTLGDAGIGAAIVQELRRVAPSATFSILSGTAGEYRRMPEFEGIPIQGRPKFPWGAPGRWPVVLAERRRVLKEQLEWADVAVFQGGPQWNDEFLDARSLVRYRRLILTASNLGTPVVLYSCSFGPFEFQGVRHGWKRRCIRGWLNRTRMIIVRDEPSVEALRRLGVDRPEIFYFPDVALRLQPARSEAADEILRLSGVVRRARPLIAVALRDHLDPYHLPGPRREEFHREIVSLLDMLVEHVGDVVCLSTGSLQDDRLVMRRLLNRTRNRHRIPLVGSSLSPALIKALYARFDVMIGMRLHACVFAISQGVPTLCIRYNRKSDYLMEQVGLTEYCHPMIGFRSAEALQTVRLLLANGADRAAVRRAIERSGHATLPVSRVLQERRS